MISLPSLVAASAVLISPGLAAGFSTELQSVLKNTHGGNEYGYPTDFTRGPETFEAVISALEPLRREGYLTTLKDNKTMTSGPITVIGTGNTPFDMVGPVANRDYFFDAHLDALEESPEITSLISPIASTSFQEAVGSVTYSEDEAVLSDKQLATLRSQISTAKERGIGARYWETPYYPIRTRNAVWRTLLQEGVALLNADDLDAVAAYF
ncbi:hypothetical protein APSETT444_004963 [Aspergillus pseudonomiae]